MVFAEYFLMIQPEKKKKQRTCGFGIHHITLSFSAWVHCTICGLVADFQLTSTKTANSSQHNNWFMSILPTINWQHLCWKSEIFLGSSGVLLYLPFKGGTIPTNISSYVNTTPANLVAYHVGSFRGTFFKCKFSICVHFNYCSKFHNQEKIEYWSAKSDSLGLNALVALICCLFSSCNIISDIFL